MEMMNNSPYFATVEAEFIKSLPVKVFPGTIHLIDHPRSPLCQLGWIAGKVAD